MTTSRDDLFYNEEQYARAAFAGWIGHSAVREILERRHEAAETTVMPIHPFS